MRRRLVLLLLLFAGLISGQAGKAMAAEEAAPNRSLLLIANEDMEDPRFRQTVVLVTRHGRSRSTIGVIVNRPTDMTAYGLTRCFPTSRNP
jgi:putative AlgH/UPF0301 family transcriptional regulator